MLCSSGIKEAQNFRSNSSPNAIWLWSRQWELQPGAAAQQLAFRGSPNRKLAWYQSRAP